MITKIQFYMSDLSSNSFWQCKILIWIVWKSGIWLYQITEAKLYSMYLNVGKLYTIHVNIAISTLRVFVFNIQFQ